MNISNTTSVPTTKQERWNPVRNLLQILLYEVAGEA